MRKKKPKERGRTKEKRGPSRGRVGSEDRGQKASHGPKRKKKFLSSGKKLNQVDWPIINQKGGGQRKKANLSKKGKEEEGKRPGEKRTRADPGIIIEICEAKRYSKDSRGGRAAYHFPRGDFRQSQKEAMPRRETQKGSKRKIACERGGSPSTTKTTRGKTSKLV